MKDEDSYDPIGGGLSKEDKKSILSSLAAVGVLVGEDSLETVSDIISEIQDEDMTPISDFPLDILNSRPIQPTFKEVLREDGSKTAFVIDPMSDFFTSNVLEPDICSKCPYTDCAKIMPSIIRLKDNPISEPMKLVVVGEGSGQEEERLGVGFVGASGQLMFNIFGKVFNENFPNTLVTNAVWCHPPANETPTAKTLKLCSQNYLFPILMNPDLIADDAIIVCVGKSAWTAVHQMATNGIKAPSILTAHSFHTELDFAATDSAGDEIQRHFRVFPMIHPAYVLRSNKLEMLAEDISSLFDLYFNVPGSITESRKGFDTTKVIIKKNTKLIKDLMTTPEVDALVQRITEANKDLEMPPVASFDVEGRNTSPADISNYLTLAGFGISETEGVQFIDKGLNNLRQLFLRFRDEGFILVGQNIYYDFMMLYRQQIIKSVDELPWYFDTMIMHHLIDENSPAGLKYLLQKYCGWPDYGAELEPHLKAVGGDYGKLPFNVLQPYHALDICGNLKLFNVLLPMVYDEKVSGLWKMDYLEFTHLMDRHLLQAAMNGMSVDRNIQAKLAAELTEIIKRVAGTLDTVFMKRLIYTVSQMSKELKASIMSTLSDFPIADALPEDPKILSKLEPFNPGSTYHLVFFLAATLAPSVKLWLKKALGGAMFTDKGRISVADGTLDAMLSTFEKLPKGISEDDRISIPYAKEVILAVKEYRAAVKLNSTYINGMLDHLWHDDRVRAHWKVTGTVTGRLSSNSPNLQQIPRGGIVKVKDMFVVSRPGYIMMNFDLSQAEVRGLASVSGDEKLIQAYRDKVDMHKFVASMAFNKPYSDITKDERQIAKSVSFGAIYGAGPRTLAAQTGAPLERAKQLLENFFNGFPKVVPWIEEQHTRLKEEGYSLGILGRKRNLPHTLSKDPKDLSDIKRESQNYPIQGLASDFNLLIVKEVLNRLDSDDLNTCWPGAPVYFVNTVHDSTMWEVQGSYFDVSSFYDMYLECVDAVNTFYREIVGDSWVDMLSEAELGLSWGSMKSLELEDTGENSVAYNVKWEEKDPGGKDKKIKFSVGLKEWLGKELHK